MIFFGTALTATELKSDFKLTTNTAKFPLSGEPWGVCWICYNDTALYFHNQTHVGKMGLDMDSVSIVNHMAGANITKPFD